MDGLAPGITVDTDLIAHQLLLRRPAGKTGTARREEDPFRIVSGMVNGKTTGTPLCLLIPNSNQRSGDYAALSGLARPGHADYTAQCKYHGFQDARGGGHFSGRITAALVASCAILAGALKQKGILIGTHVQECGGVRDRAFEDLNEDITRLNGQVFAVLDDAAGENMRAVIEAAGSEGDSVGGILETAVTGLPAGLGEPWFDTVESLLAHAMLSIPGIKGIDFGIGFDGVRLRGSEYNDAFRMENGTVITETNRNGGINGGITNGMPVCFRLAVKPTPSIYKEQKTVDFLTGENKPIAIAGRHDPAILHRARVVADSMTALVIADLLAGRYGTDYLADERK